MAQNTSMPRNTGNQNPIAKARLKAGLTQEQLAAALGVSKITVRRWECCDAFPRRSSLLALSKIFGCEPENLL